MKKLLPIAVPWMIAPSRPNLKLIATEDEAVLVQFAGFFGFEENSEFDENDQVILFDNVSINPSIRTGRYQMIVVNFSNVGWIRRSPQYSDREVIDESLFDWSDIDGKKSDEESISSWHNRFMQTWGKTKICPNPSFYLIEGSDWISESDMKKWNLKHYIVLGESSSIEILAQGYEWESKGLLVGL